MQNFISFMEGRNMEQKIYDFKCVRGRHIDVYEDKVVFTVKAGIGSFLTGNFSDGEKTIYFSDCIGVQFKKSGFQIGYLQFETASIMMNNKSDNFFNENTFTWDVGVHLTRRWKRLRIIVKKELIIINRIRIFRLHRQFLLQRN